MTIRSQHPPAPSRSLDRFSSGELNTMFGGVGDGNLTRAIVFPNGNTGERATLYYYDWRDRLVETKATTAMATRCTRTTPSVPPIPSFTPTTRWTA